MKLFSFKKDTKYIREFDITKEKLDKLVDRFREEHFKSVYLFKQNWTKEKSPSDLEKERKTFEKGLELLKDLKDQSDTLIKEASKLLKFENILTAKDKEELKKIRQKT